MAGIERPASDAAKLSWFDGWRAALAAWIMPPGFALWTWDNHSSNYDALVVQKDARDA